MFWMDFSVTSLSQFLAVITGGVIWLTWFLTGSARA